MAMKYGLLAPQEWHMVRPIFEQFGTVPPMPEMGRIAVAIDSDGNIHGMLVLQPVLHMEPMWISEDSRQEVRFTKLVKVLEDDLDRVREGSPVTYYAFATPEAEQIEGMAKLVGMETMKWKVMRKELTSKVQG